jgi:hypothetical protein
VGKEVIMRNMYEISVFAAAITLGSMGPAFSLAQDTPSDIGGVRVVCTGVGSSEQNNPSWSSYPVKLVFDNKNGQYTAGEKIDIQQDGHTVLETSCDAPWLLMKPAKGTYRVTAELQGPNGTRRTGADFSVSGNGARQTVTLAFPAAQAG